jgi:nickel/cobalt transporter (NicO) family protein
VGQSPNFLGRSPPAFAFLGYGLIVLAGIIMLVQSARASRGRDGSHALTAGIGLLPCPLTISVLGFAWTQSSAAMVALVLLSLALEISMTIGTVVVLAIMVRNNAGAALVGKLPELERGAQIIQRIAAVAIIVLGLYAVAVLPR